VDHHLTDSFLSRAWSHLPRRQQYPFLPRLRIIHSLYYVVSQIRRHLDISPWMTAFAKKKLSPFLNTLATLTVPRRPPSQPLSSSGMAPSATPPRCRRLASLRDAWVLAACKVTYLGYVVYAEQTKKGLFSTSSPYAGLAMLTRQPPRLHAK
jgi:hypothetical protein